ncbi:MAG: HDOD domain-containing protein [Gallionella sp.]
MKQSVHENSVENPAGVSEPSDGQSKMAFLLNSLRNQSDFPAISNVIAEINQIVSSDSGSSSKLARTILQDFALTTKLLKLVNTASYGQFGGTINTVSKAVVILGFETVRNISMSLIMMDFLKNKTQAVQLKNHVIQSIFMGVVATQLAIGHNKRDAEEVMVCAMFHNLGKLLTTCYFFDKSQQIVRLVAQGETEEKAAINILGVSYSKLSLAVVRSWNFPLSLITGMRKLPAGKVDSVHGEMENISLTINLADELCEIAASSTERDKFKSLNKLSKRYDRAIKITSQELSAAMDVGINELNRRAGVLGIRISNNPMLLRVRKWCGNPLLAVPESPPPGLAGSLDKSVKKELEQPLNQEAILGAGIQDVTASLVSDFNLNDVLQMVLETIYRGMGFYRVLILVRDNNQKAMVARFGFGYGIDAIIPRFHFSLPFVADVFHLSVEKGLDIAIENINAPNIANKIPEWYRNTINAPCFILLPVMLKDKAIGLIYADMNTTHSLNLTQHQLSLLRTLRNQAVLAIKQKT